VHGASLAKYKLDQKWLNTECKRVIRQTVINPKVTDIAHETGMQEKEVCFLSLPPPPPLSQAAH